METELTKQVIELKQMINILISTLTIVIEKTTYIIEISKQRR